MMTADVVAAAHNLRGAPSTINRPSLLVRLQQQQQPSSIKWVGHFLFRARTQFTVWSVRTFNNNNNSPGLIQKRKLLIRVLISFANQQLSRVIFYYFRLSNYGAREGPDFLSPSPIDGALLRAKQEEEEENKIAGNRMQNNKKKSLHFFSRCFLADAFAFLPQNETKASCWRETEPLKESIGCYCCPLGHRCPT